MKNNQPHLIALGSNLGFASHNPQDTLSTALLDFRENGLQLRRVSRYFASAAFPKGSGPDYVNAVALVTARLSPPLLLKVLHNIERKFERTRETRWGARSLDLDLLASGEKVMPDSQHFEKWYALPISEQMGRTPDELILPHPRIQDRNFVLYPLLDIDANWRHPVLGKTAAQMLADLPEAFRGEIRPL